MAYLPFCGRFESNDGGANQHDVASGEVDKSTLLRKNYFIALKEYFLPGLVTMSYS